MLKFFRVAGVESLLDENCDALHSSWDQFATKRSSFWTNNAVLLEVEFCRRSATSVPKDSEQDKLLLPSLSHFSQ